MIVTVDLEQLARLAEAEVLRHEPRTPRRRAAAHLWACFATSRTPGAARKAIRTFGDERTQSGALQLLGRLTAEVTR